MQTPHNTAPRDARDIGEKSQDIQNDTAIVAAKMLSKLIAAILDRLRQLNLLKGDRPPNISISLGDKNASQTPARIVINDTRSYETTPLSAKDVSYIESAMRTATSRGRRADLDRDLTISLDGKVLLVVKDGCVLRNDIYPNVGEVEVASEPIEAEVVNEIDDRSPDSNRQEPVASPEGQMPADEAIAEHGAIARDRETTPEAPSTANVTEVSPQPQQREMTGASQEQAPTIVPEIVPEETLHSEQPRNRDERRDTPVSPVVVILTREVRRTTKESPAREALVRNLERMGRGSRNFLAQLGNRLTNLGERVTAPFKQSDRAVRDRENLSACATAHKLLDSYGQRSGGKDVFEGNLYRFERQEGQSLSIVAKDGRGCIFQQQQGIIAENMTDFDRTRFAEIDRRLPTQERYLSRSSGNEEPELG